MNPFVLRRPRSDELDAVADLCMRSKAVWGYDAAFMRRCQPALRVDPTLLEKGQAMIAVDGRRIVGVAQVSFEAVASRTVAELDLLFVDPTDKGAALVGSCSIGRSRLRGQGRAVVMGILADPGARAFTNAWGRVRSRSAVDVFADRKLPWLEMVVPPPAS